jgi:DNA-binding NtrC family response regulator
MVRIDAPTIGVYYLEVDNCCPGDRISTMPDLGKAPIPTILIIGLSDEESSWIRAGAERFRWKTREARTYRDAMLQLCRENAGVIVCNSSLPDGGWEDILSATATHIVRPRIIVVSRHADERLWANVLNLGGFDVLPSPCRNQDVLRCIEMACRNWQDQIRQEKGMRPSSAACAG